MPISDEVLNPLAGSRVLMGYGIDHVVDGTSALEACGASAPERVGPLLLDLDPKAPSAIAQSAIRSGTRARPSRTLDKRRGGTKLSPLLGGRSAGDRADQLLCVGVRG